MHRFLTNIIRSWVAEGQISPTDSCQVLIKSKLEHVAINTIIITSSLKCILVAHIVAMCCVDML